MSTVIGIVGLVLAIAVLVIGAYKGVGALPLTLVAAFVAIVANAASIAELFSGDYIWTGFSGQYMKGYSNAYLSYFLLFACSSLYAKLMNDSGSATAIGYRLIDWFGRTRVILVTLLITAVLTYGGVSLFVVVYAVAPIAFLLFREANIPRHLTMGCVIGGSATFTMTCMPGSPQLTNVVPTTFLGTTLIAAPVLSVICSIGVFAAVLAYLMREQKVAVIKGESWSYPDGKTAADYGVMEQSKLPQAWKAFSPIIVLAAIIILGSRMGINSSKLSVFAMLCGALLCYILNFDRFKDADMKSIVGIGLDGGIAGIGGLAAVLAFGAVVQATPSFARIVEWVLSIDMHPYVRGIFATSVFSGITGSSSGGLRITLEALADNFLASGANMQTLHRLMAIAAGGLDTLPHSPGLFLMMSVLGLNHKNSYKHVFVISVVIPVITVIIATTVCIFMGV